MSCDPRRPCPPDQAGLGLVPPSPGATRLRRRSGDFAAFVDDLVRATEQHAGPGGRPLGSAWDLAGDPRALRLARLWAYVAETVAAYAELTANESYLATAADWTDLRRIAALVGYKPRPGVAASGWVRFDTDKGSAPLVPAGTKVQAPALPGVRDSQTFEVADDTQLRADWASFTATPVPVAAAPPGRDMRFLQDPDFVAGDRVLFVKEKPPANAPVVEMWDWWQYWGWLVWFAYLFVPPSGASPIALSVVEQRERELGTTIVTFDRELSGLLPGVGQQYAAYRVVASAGSARRVTKALNVTRTSAEPVAIAYASGTPAVMTYDYSGKTSSVVLDTALEDVSKGQLVALVRWDTDACDVVPIARHTFVEWEVAPGSTARVSRLSFDTAVPALASGSPVTAYVVDRRVAATHYTFPQQVTGTPPRLRLYPAPADGAAPPRIAVRSVPASGEALWEVFDCALATTQETSDHGAPRGLIVDLVGGQPAGAVDREPASGNLVRVRHGASAKGTLGSGDAIVAGQVMPVPKSPVAYDIGADGTPASTLLLRVDGLEWREVPSLYAAGPTDSYTTTLDVTGAVTARFGDGAQGNRLPTGRNNVTATYRVGGGTAGEVQSGDIDALVGSIRGVRGVEGVGPTSGGADQDDERRLRALAPARARAFGRAVSAGDLADLALGFPGVSHATAWHGAGPAGCACGASGLHLGFARTASAGPRAPLAAEVVALSDYVDGRRDTNVPLCVCAAVVSPVSITASVARDARYAAGVVTAAVRAALVDPDGPLAPPARALGQALDRSDVLSVVHAVPGVVGVPSLVITGGSGPARGAVGRLLPRGYELLVVRADTGAAPLYPMVTEVVA